MRPWHIVARTSSLEMVYQVLSFSDVAKTHERLIRDDPVWRRARIRLAPTYEEARAKQIADFWKNLEVSRLTAPSL